MVKKDGGQLIVIIVLIVLLLGALGYISFAKYSAWKQNSQLSIFQQGAQYGSEQIIRYIAQQAGPGSCQQVPLNFENQTISLIAVECLNVAQ